MTDGSRKSEESNARDERDENKNEQDVNGATAVADRVKLTDLTVVLDRSGSMGRRREAAMTSFNDFLEEHNAESKSPMPLARVRVVGEHRLLVLEHLALVGEQHAGVAMECLDKDISLTYINSRFEMHDNTNFAIRARDI